MSSQKVIFIEPSGSGTNVFDDFMRLPLTGPLALGTILHNAGHQVSILTESILPKAIDPFELNADVFCISALTVSAPRARVLAKQLKRAHPSSRIIMGGIHASLIPGYFADVADQIVTGEGESVITDIVEGRLTDKLIHGMPVEDLDSMPLMNYRLLEGYETLDIIPIMTSRGCPFDCNFCTVTKIFGKRFRMQSPRRVIDEVKNALSMFKTNGVFFYDDNFTANRKRVEELCGLIEKEKINCAWTTQVRSDVARDPELVRLMSRSGCRWFYIGFESINDETLKAYKKGQTRGDIEKAISTIHEYGINIHGMFMFGEDSDTPASMRQTVDFAIKHDIDTVQFMILTPFPGTQVYEKLELEGRLLHKVWNYFNGMFAVFHPHKMSALRLQKETLAAYRRFYSIRRVSAELVSLAFNVIIDALVWNFKRAFDYSFDLMFLKGGANIIIRRFVRAYDHYQRYLEKVEVSEKSIDPPDMHS
jgi:radical SAM superfamily enzyme YgiQ (UPF0313 family)